MRRAGFIAAALVLCVGTGCFTSSSDLTESGKGRPTVTIDFPQTVSPGANEDLVLEVSNPGPGAMDSVFVAFTNVGVPGSGFGTALVPFTTGRDNPAIAAVTPEPEAVSEDGVVYRFPGLSVGASTTITFSLVVPRTRGPAASSVQIYDGSEIDRAVGKRVTTTVRG